MDSFELNKIIGAILGTLLFVMGAGFIAEAIYHPIEGRGPGYELPLPEGEAGDDTEEPVAVLSIGTLLASANAEQGAQSMSKCQGCHNFEEGSGNKQGPMLYDVIGRQIASVEGFSYSDSLAEMGAAGETWSYEHLSDFLFAPKNFAPGTKMNFGGLKNDAERANVIAYLSTLSANPVPFPAPEPAEGATAEAEPSAATDSAIDVDETAVETPTETQSESPVVGTPVTSVDPADGAASQSEAVPAQEAAPAGQPATETVGPGSTTAQ